MACRSPPLLARSLFRLPRVGAFLAVLLTSALTASSAWIVHGGGQQQQSRRMAVPMRARWRMMPMMAAAGAGAGGKPGGPPQVLCYGEALVDRLGPLGGDPATDTPVDDRLGGAPANVACGLARLGTPVAFLGRLGEDDIGAEFRQVFAARGVNTQALQWDKSLPSRIVLVKRDAKGDREFGGFAGDESGKGFADQAVDPQAMTVGVIPLLTDAQWLLVGTLPMASALSASSLERAVEQARYGSTAVALDINWRPTFWAGHAHPTEPPSPSATARIRPLLEQAALIKFAAEEAAWLFDGQTDPRQISALLPQKPAVIVTDGANQVSWSVGKVQGRRAAFSVEAVDTTGAGDAFVAGLLHKLCADPSLLTDATTGGNSVEARLAAAMAFACACGALVCQGAGAIDPQPTAVEAAAFVEARGGG